VVTKPLMSWFDAFTTQHIKDCVRIVCARPDEPPLASQGVQPLPQLGIVASSRVIAATRPWETPPSLYLAAKARRNQRRFSASCR